MNKLWKVLCILAVLLCISSCSARMTESDDYLTFTLTYEVVDEKGSSEFKSDIYMYDFSKKVSTLAETIPYEKDYPVGIYIKSENSILYSGVTDGVSGNQVWIKNLKNGEREMLTKDFYYQAFLQPISNSQILVGGVLKDSINSAINLFELDIHTHNLVKIDVDSDVDVRHVSYDNKSQSVLFVGYSHEELSKRIEEQDTIDFAMPNNSVYEYKDGNVVKLFESTNDEILAVYRDEDNLYYRTNNLGSVCSNITSNVACSSQHSYYVDPFFNSDTHQIFYIEDKSLKVFDIDLNKVTDLFTSDKELSTINNMFYVVGGKSDE